jgi:hypothetical protein
LAFPRQGKRHVKCHDHRPLNRPWWWRSAAGLLGAGGKIMKKLTLNTDKILWEKWIDR